MRAAALGMVLLCGIAQGAEPPDADRPLGEDRKAAVVSQAKQKVVELEEKRVAAVKRRNVGLISALVNDIKLAKIELKEALKKTVEDYEREADAEAEEAARKADAKAKEAARKADAEAKEAATKADAKAKLKLVNDQFEAGPKTVTNTIDMELIGISAGTFTMSGEERDYVRTLHSPFWLGKTEVTQGQFKKVMGTAPWRSLDIVKIDKNYPAILISWEEATAFCDKLTDLEQDAGKLKKGEVYHLPYQVQWEYACRAGTQTRFSFGDDKSKVGEYAWFEGNTKDVGEGYAHAVGLKKPNPWGLHDMHGNVSEWCFDWHIPGSRISFPDATGEAHWSRGSNYFSTAENSASAARPIDAGPSRRFHEVGFRVARNQAAQ